MMIFVMMQDQHVPPFASLKCDSSVDVFFGRKEWNTIHFLSSHQDSSLLSSLLCTMKFFASKVETVRQWLQTLFFIPVGEKCDHHWKEDWFSFFSSSYFLCDAEHIWFRLFTSFFPASCGSERETFREWITFFHHNEEKVSTNYTPFPIISFWSVSHSLPNILLISET